MHHSFKCSFCWGFHHSWLRCFIWGVEEKKHVKSILVKFWSYLDVPICTTWVFPAGLPGLVPPLIPLADMSLSLHPHKIPNERQKYKQKVAQLLHFQNLCVQLPSMSLDGNLVKKMLKWTFSNQPFHCCFICFLAVDSCAWKYLDLICFCEMDDWIMKKIRIVNYLFLSLVQNHVGLGTKSTK